MPVKLEIITTPSDADWLDLSKIHHETAQHGLTMSPEALASWLSEGHWVFAGRFNDRIIGCVLAEQHGDQVQLHSAAVRAITQRRGVMHQMVHFIQRWATDNQQSIVINECPQSLHTALLKRDFQALGQTWVFNGSN